VDGYNGRNFGQGLSGRFSAYRKHAKGAGYKDAAQYFLSDYEKAVGQGDGNRQFFANYYGNLFGGKPTEVPLTMENIDEVANPVIDWDAPQQYPYSDLTYGQAMQHVDVPTEALYQPVVEEAMRQEEERRRAADEYAGIRNYLAVEQMLSEPVATRPTSRMPYTAAYGGRLHGPGGWIRSRGVNGEDGWLNTETNTFTTVNPYSGEQAAPTQGSTYVRKPIITTGRRRADVAAERAVRNRQARRDYESARADAQAKAYNDILLGIGRSFATNPMADPAELWA